MAASVRMEGHAVGEERIRRLMRSYGDGLVSNLPKASDEYSKQGKYCLSVSSAESFD